MTKQEFEELFEGRVKFGMLKDHMEPFFRILYEHMGQNELRKFFGLKEQQIDFENKVVEEVEVMGNLTEVKGNLTKVMGNLIEKFDPKDLKHFQKKIFKANKDSSNADTFRVEDVDFASKLLDQKFPGIKPLYQLKFKDKIQNPKFDKQTIDKLFDVMEDLTNDIYWKVSDMVSSSINGFQGCYGRCYKKKD